MCLECGEKACEIDARCPHFIDRYNGMFHGLLMPDEVYVPARKELWEFMQARHGGIVEL